MTVPGRPTGSNGGRRAKRFLSPSQKYEIWLALVREEVSTVEAAERARVDRDTKRVSFEKNPCSRPKGSRLSL